MRKGQLLVQLDDVLQKAELSQAQAALSIAQANLKRNEELVAQAFVAQRVLDESRAALQVAQAQVTLAQARQQRMRITAPFDGTVGLRSINLGQYVQEGQDLVNLEDTSVLTVDFRLPERYQTRIAPGLAVQVQLDALPGRSWEAKVLAVDPLLDANGRSIAVRATMPADPRRELRPGMFARVLTVFSVDDTAMVVPEEALVPQGGKQYLVNLVDGPSGGKVSQRIEARLGARLAGKVEILDGMKADIAWFERGVAVIANRPFAEGALFAVVAGRALLARHAELLGRQARGLGLPGVPLRDQPLRHHRVLPPRTRPMRTVIAIALAGSEVLLTDRISGSSFLSSCVKSRSTRASSAKRRASHARARSSADTIGQTMS